MLKSSGKFVIGVKIALALGTIFISTAANTADAAERNLRVSYSAPATAFLPLWAAKDAGIFERNNLTVELLYVGSSPIALAALLSDELDVLAGGGTAAPTAYLQGFRDLALFSTLDHRFAFKIFTVPSIVDAAGLRGKRFGVTRFGGSLDFDSRYFLKTSGLDPQKDVQRYTRMADREILKLAYDEYAQKVWPRLPAIEPDDIKLILEHLAQTNPKAREIQPAALIYNDLVDNVARSGLVERLYK